VGSRAMENRNTHTIETVGGGRRMIIIIIIIIIIITVFVPTAGYGKVM
jgi:hypothetical protein